VPVEVVPVVLVSRQMALLAFLALLVAPVWHHRLQE
jgi:hypothetical protein